MSPELINPQQFGSEKGRPTQASDCYALGMVIYETIGGRSPFHEHSDLNVVMKVVNGERPRRELFFPEELWKMLELCWAPQPRDRPSIKEVLQCLEGIPDSQGSQTLPSVWADEEGSSDNSSLTSESSGMFVIHTFSIPQRCLIWALSVIFGSPVPDE